ncbi:MAG: sensor histidine kinase [Syntrophothermus sp.]
MERISSIKDWLGARAARGGRDLLYIGAVGIWSVVAFCVWVTCLSLTLSLLVFVVGIFVWLGSVYAFRWTTWVDRRLVGWARGERIAAVYREPEEPGLLARLRCVTADPQTWKDLGWLVLNSILGFALAVVALTATVAVVAYVLMPAWWWAVPDPGTQYGTLNLGLFTVESTGQAFLVTAIGLALAPLAWLLNRGVVAGHSSLAAPILGPSESQRLRARVDDLAATRAGAVEAAQDQLERIERDLHDGAQARLVGLAMELGMAEEELREDPGAAVDTVRRARDETLAALGELRDLSRGMRPALLEERGLVAATESLLARSPLPVSLSVIGDVDGAPAQVQAAAYFVVAEGLANAAKHSGAERLRVRIERTAAALVAGVEDDGRGGARAGGSGLEGLRKRVAALDGRLEVVSPAGGPTVLRAEIPCA